mmetsp:Transcript_106848/g.255057  ORF Transcript_106848/g.255057 Transcript_106848/m.255057 type:complete len:557 (-) Transcript_106848:310-1980(-)
MLPREGDLSLGLHRLLQGGHVEVLALPRHELGVGALLQAVPAVQHVDHVRVHHRGQAVGDGDARQAPAHGEVQRVQGGLDHPLRLVVQGGGGLIQQQHLRLLGQRPCDGHPLALAPRQGAACCADVGFQALRQSRQRIQDLGHARRLDGVLVADLGPGLDVLHGAGGKEHRVLAHVSQLLAPAPHRPGAQRPAVHHDLPLDRVVEALQHLDGGALAAPALPDEGHLLALGDEEAELVQDRLLRPAGVIEANAAELDGLDLRQPRDLLLVEVPRLDAPVLVADDLLQRLGGDHRLGQRRREAREGADPRHPRDQGDQHDDHVPALQGFPVLGGRQQYVAAKPQSQGVEAGVSEILGGPEDPDPHPAPHAAPLGREQLPLEAPLLRQLRAEGRHGAHRHQRLLCHTACPREVFRLLGHLALDLLGEPVARANQHRHGGDHDERELPAVHEGQGQSAHELPHAGDQEAQAGGHEAVHRRDVSLQLGSQAGGLVEVEPGDVQGEHRLQVPQLPPQRLLASGPHEAGLPQEGQQELHQGKDANADQHCLHLTQDVAWVAGG